MTNNRYIHIQGIQIESYELDCPVEIEKGALLFDNLTKSILLQLRLGILNTENQEISSVKLKIECRDDAGDEIPNLKKVDDIYKEVNVLKSRTFGEKRPIVLDPRVRKVKVGIGLVTFKNGETWNSSGIGLKLPKIESIEILDKELLEQLERDINSQKSEEKKKVIYFPKQLRSYWTCTCGMPNSNNRQTCCRCDLSKDWIFKTIDRKNLQENLEKFREESRLIEEQKSIRGKKTKKILSRVMLIS